MAQQTTGQSAGTTVGASTTYRARGAGREGFPRDRTAVLVIDPVNDFLSDGGAAWELTRATVKMNDVIGNLKHLLAGARSHGLPVLFGPMAFTREDYAEAELHHKSGINRIMFERRMFLAGSWGADFHPDLRPQEGDVVLLPHKTNDVFQTDLPDELERLGITHLVIAGMTANLCVEATGRHAMERGYDVTFLSDATGAADLPGYEASIHVNFPQVGNAVMDVKTFIAALDDPADGPMVKEGDVVRGSDNMKIGSVERVVDAEGDADAHMVVSRGLVFDREAFIPLDAVVKRAGDEVFVNVPKIIAGKMPWNEPPTRGSTDEKLGPPARDVGALYGSVSPTADERAR